MEPASSFKTHVVRQAHDYWHAKAATGRLPSRADINPEEMRAILPYVYLVDVLHQPLRFRFRLVGTQIRVWAAREYTGIDVSEQDYGPNWRIIHEQYRAVTETKVPIHDDFEALWVNREFQHYERFLAPLASDGNSVDMLFGALYVIESSLNRT
jgi:hypothetical protein